MTDLRICLGLPHIWKTNFHQSVWDVAPVFPHNILSSWYLLFWEVCQPLLQQNKPTTWCCHFTDGMEFSASQASCFFSPNAPLASSRLRGLSVHVHDSLFAFVLGMICPSSIKTEAVKYFLFCSFVHVIKVCFACESVSRYSDTFLQGYHKNLLLSPA